MLKTGIKSFVYSFSVSLFAIVSANRAFFYEKNENPSELDIQNKSIALYLAETKPSYVPVKKIALNSLPEIQKQQVQTPPLSEPEIIVASNLENIDIPLEFVEDMAEIPGTHVPPEMNRAVREQFSRGIGEYIRFHSAAKKVDHSPVVDFGTFMDNYEE